MVRSLSLENYYKKFFCPSCKDYSIRVMNDLMVECSNCDLPIDISEILVNNDFKGFFSRKEIEDNFSINELDMIPFKNYDYIYKVIPQKLGSKINTYYIKKDNIEIKLDELFIKYLESENIMEIPDEPTSFGYFITLIEEIHHFINRAVQDIKLADIAMDFNKRKQDNLFLSGRFYFHNAADNIWYAIERIWVFLGLQFDYPFSNTLKYNTTSRIKNHLRKDERYKSSAIKVKMEGLMGVNSYNEIIKMRELNSHDYSYNINYVNEQVKQKKKSNIDFDRDSNDVDIDMYIPKINNYIDCIEACYILLDEIIDFTNKNISKSKSINIVMLNHFSQLPTFVPDSEEKIDLMELEIKKNKLFKLLRNFGRYNSSNIKYLFDVFFRLEECQKCLIEYYNIETGEFYRKWCMESDYITTIDQSYLIYSILQRIHACFDKVTKYITKSYPRYEKIAYFEGFSDLDFSGKIVNKARFLLSKDEFKELSLFRNSFAHNLRPGSLFGKNAISYNNDLIFYICYKCVLDCYSFIEYIAENEVKINRNDLCYCGSGKKYKKCCLEN